MTYFVYNAYVIHRCIAVVHLFDKALADRLESPVSLNRFLRDLRKILPLRFFVANINRSIKENGPEALLADLFGSNTASVQEKSAHDVEHSVKERETGQVRPWPKRYRRRFADI